jgi:heme/copper-type cytochrome/quinol oxidase subunit 4
MRRGDVVLLALGVFTAAEFIAAIAMDGVSMLTVLAVLAAVKAALILNYFMHFHQLWEHAVQVWDSFWLDTSGDEEQRG